jgi:uncharacterized membrane protein YadS
MKKDKMDISFWLIMAVANAIVIYLASLLFPMLVVLGNDKVPNILALLFTALLLTLILSLVAPVSKILKLKVTGDLSINTTYGIANIAGLWVLGRLASFIGLGISSFVVAIVLGVILSIVQFVLWRTLAGKKGRK